MPNSFTNFPQIPARSYFPPSSPNPHADRRGARVPPRRWPLLLRRRPVLAAPPASCAAPRPPHISFHRRPPPPQLPRPLRAGRRPDLAASVDHASIATTEYPTPRRGLPRPAPHVVILELLLKVAIPVSQICCYLCRPVPAAGVPE
jgi:hypothetical protein